MKDKRLKYRLMCLKVDERLYQLCMYYGTTPKELLDQIQADFLAADDKERAYEIILAQLLLAEHLARKAKVDRGTIEQVMAYMRNYEEEQRKAEAIPNEQSSIAKSILKACQYNSKHAKN